MKLSKLLPFRRVSQPKIFISYRRDDSETDTDFLYEQLAHHFGKEHVFMDIDNIPVGRDFVEVIEAAVSSCDVLIAVIGKQWLTITAGEKRRLDNPDDFVRLEVAAALRRRILVIPLLVRGATMPRQEDLPEELKGLVRRHAFVISRNRRREDGERLAVEIKRVLAEQPSGVKLPTTADLSITTTADGTTKEVRASTRALVSLGIVLLLIVMAGSFWLMFHTRSTPPTGVVVITPTPLLAPSATPVAEPSPTSSPSPTPTATPTQKRQHKPRKPESILGRAVKKIKKSLQPF